MWTGREGCTLVRPRPVWTGRGRGAQGEHRRAWNRGGGSSQGAGGQVRVFVLELPVQGEAPLLSVVGQEGGQRVDLAERGAGRHRVAGKKGGRCRNGPRSQPQPGPDTTETTVTFFLNGFLFLFFLVANILMAIPCK